MDSETGKLITEHLAAIAKAISQNNNSTIDSDVLSALLGAVLGAVVAGLFSLYIFNKTKTDNNNYRLYAKSQELQKNAGEMLNTSYKIAGKLHDLAHEGANHPDPLKEEIRNLSGEFWGYSNLCHECISELFPDLKEDHESLLATLRTIPSIAAAIDTVIKSELLAQYEGDFYNLEYLGKLNQSCNEFKNKVKEHRQVKKAKLSVYS